MSFGVPAVLLMIGRQTTPKKLWTEAKRKEFPIIMICGIAQALTAFSFLRGLQLDFMNVASLSAVYVIINVFVAYFFLKERGNLIKKIIVATVIVGSIIMITLA